MEQCRKPRRIRWQILSIKGTASPRWAGRPWSRSRRNRANGRPGSGSSCLFDKGTFQETQLFVKHRSTLFGLGEKEINADGVVTGFGRVNGRIVYAAAQDFTSAGGSLGEMHAQKIWKVMDMAVDAKKPFVALNDSGGARIQEGITALQGYSGIFYRNSIASGYIPQISADHGSHGRRRRLLAGPHGLGLHGEEDELHVPDRSRRGQGGHRRGGEPRGSRRCHGPCRQERCLPFRRGK